MTVARGTSSPPLRGTRSRWVAGTTVLATAVALVALLSPGAAAYSVGDAVSWSNGVVMCQFTAGSPTVAISQASVNGTGVTVGFLSLSEAAPNQSVVAVANLQGLTWNRADWSNEDAFDMGYTLQAPLVASSGSFTPVGSVDLTIQFVLPAYQGSPKGPTDAVNVLFTVTSWTWQQAGDHLALAFAAAPSFPGTEHLNASSAPAWLLASTSNSSGAVLEQIGANSSATATTASGSTASVRASTSLAIASPQWATVAVTFGTSAGTFTSLAYTVRVGIVLPAAVAGIPLPELVAAGAAGVVVSVMVAVTARRVRRKPSKLVYVNEEENA